MIFSVDTMASQLCLVDDSGVEPLTSSLSRKYSTAEIIIQNLVLLDGFEPSTSPYQRDILPLQTMGAYKDREPNYLSVNKPR
jgi:hypothetical protein